MRGGRMDEGVEGHWNVVDLEMCSKINTKTFCIYTTADSAELHHYSTANNAQLSLQSLNVPAVAMI